MRQAVYRYHAGRPGYTLVTRSSTYISDMATAKFCLAPTGGGHGKRQVRAFAHGRGPRQEAGASIRPLIGSTTRALLTRVPPKAELP
jgi:hypothetical protein